MTEMEEAAFTLRIAPMKIAVANEIGFIRQTLAAGGRGQGEGPASARPDMQKRVPPTPPRQSRTARMFCHPERKRGISPMMVDYTNLIGAS